ncbi:MAG: hypothetical protein K0R71_1129 [Bacillales bacterium]|jgi:beta-N-acetylglucosaminidase|nr:hypothetical protein [Bacillales bacterium]
MNKVDLLKLKGDVLMKIGNHFVSNIDQLNAIKSSQKPQVQSASTVQFDNLLASAINQLLLETGTQTSDQSSVFSNTQNPQFGNLMGNNNGLESFIANTSLNSPALYSLLGSLATDSYLSNSGSRSTFLSAYSTNTSNDYLGVNNNQPLSFNQISPEILDQELDGKLQGMGQVFYQAGKIYNVDPALLAAISQHETGNGKSQAANEKNNVAGMMGPDGLKSYPSVEASIMDMARNISNNYLGKGLSDISKIGAKYAPIGASNDPTGLNNHWVNGVNHYYNQLKFK